MAKIRTENNGERGPGSAKRNGLSQETGALVSRVTSEGEMLHSSEAPW